MPVGDALRSAKAAASGPRFSFFVGVALVPSFLSEVLARLDQHVPAWFSPVTLGVAILALWIVASRAELKRKRLQGGSLAGIHTVNDITVITDLILTVDLTKRDPQNLHTLLPLLSGLRRVWALAGQQSEPVADLDDEFRRLADQTGRQGLHCQVLGSLPLFDIEEDVIRDLSEKLAGLKSSRDHTDAMAVDVTGGTIPMSLAAYLAAARAGLPVTYTASAGANGSRKPVDLKFQALIALSDPTGRLTGVDPLPALTTVEL